MSDNFYIPQNASELFHYEALWKFANPFDEKVLAGQAAVLFFRKSGLSIKILGAIWLLSSQSNTLNMSQFFSFVRYVTLTQHGQVPLYKGYFASTSKMILEHPRFNDVIIPKYHVIPVLQSPRNGSTSIPNDSLNGSDWIDYIPQNDSEKYHYDSLWDCANSSGTGELAGQAAVFFFQKSGLDIKILKQIWILSTTTAVLTKPQFFTAIRFVAISQNNRSVPLSRDELDSTTTSCSELPAFKGFKIPAYEVRPALYAITPKDHAEYHELFLTSDMDKDGFLTKEHSFSILRQLSLTDDKLALIFSMADFDKDDQLNSKEFCVAFHIIVCVIKNALPMPETLPTMLEGFLLNAPDVPVSLSVPENVASTAPSSVPQTFSNFETETWTADFASSFKINSDSGQVIEVPERDVFVSIVADAALYGALRNHTLSDYLCTVTAVDVATLKLLDNHTYIDRNVFGNAQSWLVEVLAFELRPQIVGRKCFVSLNKSNCVLCPQKHLNLQRHSTETLSQSTNESPQTHLMSDPRDLKPLLPTQAVVYKPLDARSTPVYPVMSLESQTHLKLLATLHPQLTDFGLHGQQFTSLAAASPQTIEYLKTLGDNGLIAEQQYAFIRSSPLLHEYYIAFNQAVSSAVLACQSINSGMIADMRVSTSENIMSCIDMVANASGFPGVSIATGVCSFLVKLSNDASRVKSVGRVTTSFPSVDSHKFIEILSRELTVLQQDKIHSIASSSKVNGSSYLDILNRSVEWLQTLNNLPTVVQTFAASQASVLLRKLMSMDPAVVIQHADIVRLIGYIDESNNSCDLSNRVKWIRQGSLSPLTSVKQTSTPVVQNKSGGGSKYLIANTQQFATMTETDSLKIKLAEMEEKARKREERDRERDHADNLRNELDRQRDSEIITLREESEKQKRIAAVLQKDVGKLSPKEFANNSHGGQAQAMQPQPTTSSGGVLYDKVHHHEARIENANMAIGEIIVHLEQSTQSAAEKDEIIAEMAKRLAMLESKMK